jgi:hypothetical protein
MAITITITSDESFAGTGAKEFQLRQYKVTADAAGQARFTAHDLRCKRIHAALSAYNTGSTELANFFVSPSADGQELYVSAVLNFDITLYTGLDVNQNTNLTINAIVET